MVKGVDSAAHCRKRRQKEHTQKVNTKNVVSEVSGPCICLHKNHLESLLKYKSTIKCVGCCWGAECKDLSRDPNSLDLGPRILHFKPTLQMHKRWCLGPTALWELLS